MFAITKSINLKNKKSEKKKKKKGTSVISLTWKHKK